MTIREIISDLEEKRDEARNGMEGEAPGSPEHCHHSGRDELLEEIISLLKQHVEEENLPELLEAYRSLKIEEMNRIVNSMKGNFGKQLIESHIRRATYLLPSLEIDFLSRKMEN